MDQAKLNEMPIDGHRLMAPQGSNGFSWSNPAKGWKVVGGTVKSLRIPDDSYESMSQST